MMKLAWSVLLRLLPLAMVGALGGTAFGGEPAPLRQLPRDRLAELGPVLRGGDIALLESNDQGGLKQITLIALVAAPPQVVREVLVHPEKYREFARNLSRSEVKYAKDGSPIYTYQLDYTIFAIDGTHRYALLPMEQGPAASKMGAAPVELFDADPTSDGKRHFRWEFYTSGSGTIVVLYGYSDVHHSGGVINDLIKRIPSLEHGMALVPQYALLHQMKGRAEQLAGEAGRAALPQQGNANYDFLVERGLTAFLRTRDGRLGEISFVDQSRARPDLLLSVASQAGQWSGFVPSITKSHSTTASDGATAVELEQSVPLLSFRTTYGVRVSPNAVDMFGLSGDLRGGRMRWDIRTKDGRSQLVLRTSQSFDKASMIIRQLYRLEPLFEYGINLSLAMLIQRGVKWRAEQMMAQR